jgi:protein-L-isoaspartate(D-aspartate) O-methyltransferase
MWMGIWLLTMREEPMNTSAVCRIVFGLWMAALVMWLAGCGAIRPESGPGETSALSGTHMPDPAALTPPAVPTDPYAATRQEMVRDQLAGRDVTDSAVLDAMRRVPRHRFVPDAYISAAYEDHPLPIGYGQTISQPYVVGLMTQALEVQPGDRVLEVGTGSGYQAAVLAALGVEVYTIEIIPDLAEQARARLAELGYGGAQVLTGDGYYGWDEHAPYDAIIVTAAPDHLPQPLIGQLRQGGRLIIPIGPPGSYQTLWLFEKVDGEVRATDLGGVMFVPLTGKGH